jgi:iron complex outermembrane receptor protein
VSLYGAGGVSSLPVIHGMADDRLRVQVDGMNLFSACPNHMNPPLSYISPSQVGTVNVWAGITPVSVGGDSIGGTIAVESPAPEFSESGQGTLFKGEASAYFGSNGNAKRGSVSATVASDIVSVTYRGAAALADNYTAGGDFKNFTATGRSGHTLSLDTVGSTAYEVYNHILDIAARNENHLFQAQFGFQDTPKELYPNQRMDMTDNTEHRFNLRYLGKFDWGSLEARAYHETVDHSMNFGDDKQFCYTTAPGMPMNTSSKNTGATAKASINLSSQDILRIGAEYQHYELDDWWPPSGTGGMSPYTFVNINNGKRDRTALFGEWEKQLNPQWMTLLGLRYERVETNADPIHGYNLATAPTVPTPAGMMNQTRDAANFNNANRDKTDDNVDVTLLARYTADATRDVEFGFARKVRSPNLYERYSWSTANMMAVMNNFVGDGNGYIGNPDLKPEKAHTLSATANWHAADRSWEFTATPYFTHVTDYIDAIQWNGATNAPATTLTSSKFVALKYVNQTARLYGLDLAGHMPLAKTGMGDLGLKGMLNYTHGENRDTGDGLYNVMPLNAKLSLTQKFGGWDNSAELVMARRKDDVSDMRNEIKTPGYGIVNLRGSYNWKKARADFGVENIFDKLYYLPTGGAYLGQGMTMSINGIPWGIAVPGMGRSIYGGLTVKF